MPGKIKVTKEMIVDCAFNITRKEGVEKVNARRIGKELNCSIHPIYYLFGTMDALRDEIINKAKSVYNQYFNEGLDFAEKRFKKIGINYINFAQNEKELFKLLFMRNAKYQINNMDDIDNNNEYIWNELCSEYNLSKEQAKKIHLQTWIATHGIAVLIATDFMFFSKETISEYLTNVFVGLLKEIKGESNNVKSE